MGHLRHILGLILDRFPNSRAIVSGDFNVHRLAVSAISLSRAKEANLTWPAASDHAFIKVSLELVKIAQDIGTHQIHATDDPERDVRRAATSDEVITEMLKPSFKIAASAKELVHSYTKPQNVIHQWYYPWSNPRFAFSTLTLD